MKFADRLERNCRKLIEQLRTQQYDGPLGSIHREIALILNQLDRERHVHRAYAHELSDLAQQTRDKLLNLQGSQGKRYDVWLGNEQLRNTLIRTQMRVEWQQHQLLRDHERDIRSLQDRLLILWDRACQLGLFNEPKRRTRKTRTTDS